MTYRPFLVLELELFGALRRSKQFLLQASPAVYRGQGVALFDDTGTGKSLPATNLLREGGMDRPPPPDPSASTAIKTNTPACSASTARNTRRRMGQKPRSAATPHRMIPATRATATIK